MARAKPLILGDATSLERGDAVYALGSPMGMDFSFIRGMVSHHSRQRKGFSYIQIDAAINPGNSGGPLLDENGRVVGIITMIMARADGMGLAIPVNYLYDGEHRLPAVEATYDKLAWKKRLALTAAEYSTAQATAAETNRRIIPTQAQATASEINAKVIFHTKGRPPTQASFEILIEGKVKCVVNGTISKWKEVKSEDGEPATGTTGLEPAHEAVIRIPTKGCPEEVSQGQAVLLAPKGVPDRDRVLIEQAL
jgi:hypothetical protein